MLCVTHAQDISTVCCLGAKIISDIQFRKHLVGKEVKLEQQVRTASGPTRPRPYPADDIHSYHTVQP